MSIHTWPKWIYTHRVVKRDKRLWIERLETGEVVYTPPDFLRSYIRDRNGLIAMAAELTTGTDYITAVIRFESGLRPGGTT